MATPTKLNGEIRKMIKAFKDQCAFQDDDHWYEKCSRYIEKCQNENFRINGIGGCEVTQADVKRWFKNNRYLKGKFNPLHFRPKKGVVGLPVYPRASLGPSSRRSSLGNSSRRSSVGPRSRQSSISEQAGMSAGAETNSVDLQQLMLDVNRMKMEIVELKAKVNQLEKANATPPAEEHKPSKSGEGAVKNEIKEEDGAAAYLPPVGYQFDSE